PAPTGTISSQTLIQDIQAVNGEVLTFLQTYFNDVQTILFATGTGSTPATPSSNRAAFDQAVGTALATLNTNIQKDLSNLPASLTATLNATIQKDLLSATATPSATGTDLQDRLAALQTPSSTKGISAWVFVVGSLVDISQADGKVNHDIVT